MGRLFIGCTFTLDLKFAAIDIGSNAVRLFIARVLIRDKSNEPLFKNVEFIRLPIRLGDDVFRTGEISEEKTEQLQKGLHAFKNIMDIHDIHSYRGCATSAIREAANGKQILKSVEDKYGLSIDMISGIEESQILMRSVLDYFPVNGNYLNVDLGGGSIEITIIEDHLPILSRSFEIGTVRLMDGGVNKKLWAELEAWIKENTAGMGKLTGIGTGGNIRKLQKIAIPSSIDEPLPIETLTDLHKRIKSMTMQERIFDLNLNPDRADVIEHAAKTFINVMQWADVDQIYTPDAGLKYGIIMQLWDEHLKNQESLPKGY